MAIQNAMQTSYGFDTNNGLLGAQVTIGQGSFTTGKASANTDFGVFVRVSTPGTPSEFATVGANTDTIMGVTAYANKTVNSDGTVRYNTGNLAAIQRTGDVWVKSVGACSKDALAHVLLTGANAGAVTATSSANTREIGTFRTDSTTSVSDTPMVGVLLGELNRA